VSIGLANYFTNHPTNNGCLNIPLGITPQQTSSALSPNIQAEGPILPDTDGLALSGMSFPRVL